MPLHTKTFFVAEAEVEFTFGEVELLDQLAKGHYSPECRGAAERGGLVYMLGNLKFPGEPIRARLTTTQLDLLAKVARQTHLAVKLGDILRFLNRCYSETPKYL